ncbi:MAG: hypothetical protein CBD25_001140 [Candidatus Pelagibacter sp. TMED165]|nr:MAG: hypothetical protein CBD25_001140 [Candidatus Pelagibacter sp. TMED165]|tara:strand:+ start:227 stop:868 length:642 start_codon:yes stop_codon:yes gene_type:complete
MINFLTGNIGNANREALNSFKKLPADIYEKSKGYFFRFRKYSRIVIENAKGKKKIDFVKNNFFFQEKKRNRYAGGKKRIFKEIDQKVLKYFVSLFLNQFQHLFLGKKKIEVGFHQLRIKCSKDFVGYPVPEGWHKDGFDFVIIINFNSENVEGGITRIKENLINKDAYSSFLNKGDYILLNDKKYYHYTDPINVSKKAKSGNRDTLVITVKHL